MPRGVLSVPSEREQTKIQIAGKTVKKKRTGYLMERETQKNEYIQIDLVRFAKALWHRAWAIVLAMLLFGAAGFYHAYYQITPLYRASALMYVNNSSISVGSTSVSLGDLSTSQALVQTYAVILKTRLTLNEVIERAGLNYSYNQLNGMVSAASVNDTEIFRITVTSADPVEAELIANTIVEVLPKKIEEIMDGCSARAVDYAVVPTAKSSPNITSYVEKGLLLGFVISCGIIILIELLDEQIRDEDYLTQTYDLPVLAGIPDLLSPKTRSGYGGYYAPRKGERIDHAAQQTFTK